MSDSGLERQNRAISDDWEEPLRSLDGITSHEDSDRAGMNPEIGNVRFKSDTVPVLL